MESLSFLSWKNTAKCPQGLGIRQWSCSSHFPSASPEAMFVLASGYPCQPDSWPEAGMASSDGFSHRNLEEGHRKPPAAKYECWIRSLVSQRHHLWATPMNHAQDSKGSQSSASKRNGARVQSEAETRAMQPRKTCAQFPVLTLWGFTGHHSGSRVKPALRCFKI